MASKEWIEIEPGVFIRQIPVEERQVDREFVVRVAETVSAPHLRQLILETGERPPGPNPKRRKKSILKALLPL